MMMLNCIFLVTVMYVSEMESVRVKLVRQPFGIKMCSQLCQNLSDCKVFQFIQQELSCTVLATKEKSVKGRIQKERTQLPKYAGTSKSAMSETKAMMYVRQLKTDKGHGTLHHPDVLLGFVYRDTTVFQLLKSETIKRSVNFTTFNNIEYIQKMHMVIAVPKEGKEIIMIPLLRSELRIVKTRSVCTAVKVDQTTQRIFVSVKLTFRKVRILSMEPKDKILRKIIEFNHFRCAFDLGLHESAELMYAAVYTSVISFTYSGLQVKVFRMGQCITRLCLDTTTNLVFYKSWKTVVRLDLSTNTTTDMQSLYTLHGLRCDKNYVFISRGYTLLIYHGPTYKYAQRFLHWKLRPKKIIL